MTVTVDGRQKTSKFLFFLITRAEWNGVGFLGKGLPPLLPLLLFPHLYIKYFINKILMHSTSTIRRTSFPLSTFGMIKQR